MVEHIIVPPIPSPETHAFWDAARGGHFILRACATCAKAHWYPRPICPFCGGETKWKNASGRGRIYSFSIMRRARVPYAIAYVTLDEGPTIMTNIVDCALDAVRIGLCVRMVFRPSESGQPVPVFVPADG